GPSDRRARRRGGPDPGAGRDEAPRTMARRDAGARRAARGGGSPPPGGARDAPASGARSLRARADPRGRRGATPPQRGRRSPMADGARGDDVRKNGQADFDFFMGRWTVRNRRLKERLKGSDTWEEFEGTATARPLWGGQANVDEIVADTPSGPL